MSAAVDTFASYSGAPNSPLTNGVAVVPSDSADLSNVTRSLWVGTVGNVELILLSGQSVVLMAVPSGTLLNVRASRVKSGSTTAADLVALW
jgi:hypothetical protein